MFFAYIGFDVVATTAEETKKPQRDMPIGIIASLVICTILYCAVALVVTGMVSYRDLDPAAALANAFVYHGQGWMATVIAAGAVAGLTTVVLTLLIGATRIIFAMSRDGLLPQRLAKVHPRFRTPWVISIVVTLIVAVVAGVTPVGVLEEMVNIGTLSAFVLVSVGVIVLRRTRPDLKRGFRVPLNPVLPILSALICTYLMLNLSVETWLRFLIWLALGFVIYFAYSRRHARVGAGDLLDPSVPGWSVRRRSSPRTRDAAPPRRGAASVVSRGACRWTPRRRILLLGEPNGIPGRGPSCSSPGVKGNDDHGPGGFMGIARTWIFPILRMLLVAIIAVALIKLAFFPDRPAEADPAQPTGRSSSRACP